MFNNKIKQVKRGFTLIELMIVIVILGVLIAAGLGSFVSSQKKGRDNRRKSDLRNISGALELYYNDYGKYPGDDGVGHIVGCGTSGTTVCPLTCSNGTQWAAGGTDGCQTTYMIIIPTDPTAGQKYFYRYSSSGGTGYQLYAALENTFDSAYNASGYSGTNCSTAGSTLCTYGISSGNITP